MSKFTTNKSKSAYCQTATFFLVAVFIFFSYIEHAMAGGGFSDQGNAVYRGLIQELIKQKICTDNLSCSTKLNLYRSDGKKIYFNMYGQHDIGLTTNVITFLIHKGLNLSEGMPIILHVYPKQKKEYINSISLFSKNDELIKLEIKK